MRRNRVIFLILWILSLIGISVRGGTVTYGLFFLLSLLPVISLLYIVLVILTFKVYQRVEGREIICNRKAVFYFSLQNESPFLFSGVKAEFFSSFFTISGISDGTEYELAPKSGIRKRTDMICHYRGEYEVGIRRLIVQDYLRLFSIPYRNREPYIALVKPDIVQLSDIRNAKLMIGTMEDAAERTEPDLLSREYVNGDDVRLINWKTSAATNRLMVRERTGERQQGVGIVFEPERCSDKKEIYLPVENKILEAVIALTLYLSRQGIPVSVYFSKKETEEMHVDRENGFEELYAAASEFRFRETGTAKLLYEELLQRSVLYEKKAVFFIVNRWDAALFTLADRLSLGNVSVVVYLISDEEQEKIREHSKVKVIRIATDADLTEVM